MARRLRPGRWTLLDACSAKCSVNKANIGEENALLVHGWYENGLNDHKIAANAFQTGMDLSSGALGRHRSNHLRRDSEIMKGTATEKLSDLF